MDAVLVYQRDSCLLRVLKEDEVRRLAKQFDTQHSIEVEEAEVGRTLKAVEVHERSLPIVGSLSDDNGEHRVAEVCHYRLLKQLLGSAGDHKKLFRRLWGQRQQVNLHSRLLFGSSVVRHRQLWVLLAQADNDCPFRSRLLSQDPCQRESFFKGRRGERESLSLFTDF